MGGWVFSSPSSLTRSNPNKNYLNRSIISCGLPLYGELLKEKNKRVDICERLCEKSSGCEMKPQRFNLTIELVPTSVWFSSLYQFYNRTNQPDQWRKIKVELFEKEGRKCWICGKEGDRFEAHEFWEYDETNHVQRLRVIHHLCRLCHKIKHIGFWCYTKDGQRKLARAGLTREALIRHFCKVNNCSREEFETHETEAFRIWRERSQHEWIQDFGTYTPEIAKQRTRKG